MNTHSLNRWKQIQISALGCLISSASAAMAQQGQPTQTSQQEKTLSTPVPAPASCLSPYHGTWGLRCINAGEGIVSPHQVQGTSPASIALLNRFCREVPLGRALGGVTPPPGSWTCYQFVVNEATPVNFQLKLPAGISATAELSYARKNGQGLTLSRAKTVDGGVLSGGVSSIQYGRIFLSVRTSNGSGGEPFPLIFNGTLPDPTPQNTAFSNALRIDMNEELNTSLSDPLDEAYYFFPLDSGQTRAIFTTTFNASNQTISVFHAQEAGAGILNISGENIIPHSHSAGQPYYFYSPYPANSPGRATVSGFAVRVKGINASAPPNQRYKLRIGTRDLRFSETDLENNEEISRWFPSDHPRLQVANWVGIRIGIKDLNGFWVKNQPVSMVTQHNILNTATRQIAADLKTNAEGKANVNNTLAAWGLPGYALKTTFPQCSGAVIHKYKYGAPGTPTDRYNGTAQNGRVTLSLPGSYPETQLDLSFLRICSETYLGRK